jgi:hypothetical protein
LFKILAIGAKANTFRTPIRNIVLKSSLSRIEGARLNFGHLNPGSAVQHIGELNDLFKGLDLQLIAVSETWFNMVLMVSGLFEQTGD